ncbi:hypothetical protein MSHOH_3448 [Methanosarcina horonobensis HB-1 = JCM 15518]|uniref:Uncharacterized protein n=1 Tax=Methanosarcina horonobensis HB-1 = JCM 15518 TaxID=1434110 RepID=A0A0E3SFN8_9EURY|nr:hypothetical protein [Methanosarcina horonobensis]AKB79931.1 hypothetical protein MSHOH_3448 [Methanosarcina horonobensis HB-1 = JCM 15518]
MKKYVYFILFILLISVDGWGFAGSQNVENASQPGSPLSTIQSTYQDIAWGTNVQKNLKILKTDLDGISGAVNNSDYVTLAVYARQTVNDTQNAIQENDQYTVSPKLQDAQNEWRMALLDYNSAGQFLLKGANEAKNGTGGAEYFQKANVSSNSGTDHLKRASELAGTT